MVVVVVVVVVVALVVLVVVVGGGGVGGGVGGLFSFSLLSFLAKQFGRLLQGPSVFFRTAALCI